MFKQHRTTVAAMPGSRFGGWVPKDDPRVQLSLYRVLEKLYFLNQTTQLLDKVSNISLGIMKTDDEGGAASTAVFQVAYTAVQPGEAVLIDEFDEFLDADCLIDATITVEIGETSESFHATGKGGPGTQVLKKR